MKKLFILFLFNFCFAGKFEFIFLNSDIALKAKTLLDNPSNQRQLGIRLVGIVEDIDSLGLFYFEDSLNISFYTKVVSKHCEDLIRDTLILYFNEAFFNLRLGVKINESDVAICFVPTSDELIKESKTALPPAATPDTSSSVSKSNPSAKPDTSAAVTLMGLPIAQKSRLFQAKSDPQKPVDVYLAWAEFVESGINAKNATALCDMPTTETCLATENDDDGLLNQMVTTKTQLEDKSGYIILDILNIMFNAGTDRELLPIFKKHCTEVKDNFIKIKVIDISKFEALLSECEKKFCNASILKLLYALMRNSYCYIEDVEGVCSIKYAKSEEERAKHLTKGFSQAFSFSALKYVFQDWEKADYIDNYPKRFLLLSTYCYMVSADLSGISSCKEISLFFDLTKKESCELESVQFSEDEDVFKLFDHFTSEEIYLIKSNAIKDFQKFIKENEKTGGRNVTWLKTPPHND